jgi:hypothetical protein
MNRVLTTFAFGEQADLLSVSLPTFQRYAWEQGYDLFVPGERLFNRPWSWFKLPLIVSLLHQYDEVLWLDADVVVRRFDKDIFDDAGDAPLAMVVHRTADGEVPNAGVWVVRSRALEFLENIWHLDGFKRSDGWWEQAAVIAGLGGDPDATPTSTPRSDAWTELPYEWNPHVRDARGVPDDCRFFHATTLPDRKAAMLKMRTWP